MCREIPGTIQSVPGDSRYDSECAGIFPVHSYSACVHRVSISNLEIQVRVSISNLEIRIRISPIRNRDSPEMNDRGISK